MKIEVLFPEVCNLYGDPANVTYLRKSLEHAVKLVDGSPVYDLEIIETHLTDKPLFVREQPDLIYMGTMTENSQLLVISKLLPYRERLQELIECGTNFLITGNAVEVFGNSIIEDENIVTNGLGILNIDAKRSSIKRENSLYVGNFDAGDDEALKIVGFKSVFGYIYGDELENRLFDTVLGYGSNPDTKNEGIRINNFIATQIIGPVLILNPLLTKWYMNVIFEVGFDPVYFEDAMLAYQARLDEYLTQGKGWTY